MDAPHLLWAALLLCSPGVMPEVHDEKFLQKPTISLTPPWNRIFTGESVQLTCNLQDNLIDSPTTWIHNNNTLSVRNSTLDVVNADFRDMGEYRCQKESGAKSDPVSLYVYSGWLLLQVTPVNALEGEPLFIRCHSWRNLEAKKVIYYKDGLALKYYYENHNISISKASLSNSGTYFCQGHIKKINHSSTSLQIVVRTKDDNLKAFYLLYFYLRLLVLVLFVVDTGLHIWTQRQFTDLLNSKRSRRSSQKADPRVKSYSKTD